MAGKANSRFLNAITSSTVRDGITLRLGWVKEC